jgi:hypothetical protein
VHDNLHDNLHLNDFLAARGFRSLIFFSVSAGVDVPSAADDISFLRGQSRKSIFNK